MSAADTRIPLYWYEGLCLKPLPPLGYYASTTDLHLNEVKLPAYKIPIRAVYIYCLDLVMGSERELKIRFVTLKKRNKDLKAILDSSVGPSIITEAQVKKTGAKYDHDPMMEDEGSLAGSYKVIGKIELDCRATRAIAGYKGHPFYVVKTARAPVVLGNSSPLYLESNPAERINIMVVEVGPEQSQKVSDETEQQAAEFDEESAEMARERRELRARFRQPRQSSSQAQQPSSQPQQSNSQPPRGSNTVKKTGS